MVKLTAIIPVVEAGHTYLGTDCPGPPHVHAGPLANETERHWEWCVDSEQLAAEANRLWEWYVNSEPLDRADLSRARELVAAYSALGVELKLIELADTPGELEIGRFVGCDISARGQGNSLVFHAFVDDPNSPTNPLVFHGFAGNPRARRDRDPLWAIAALINEHFRSRINEYGLIADLETAALLRDVILSVDHCQPGYFESGIEVYQVVCIGLVGE